MATEDVVQTEVGEDGIKYVTEVKIKEGKRYKVTKKVRAGMKEIRTSKRVEDRKVRSAPRHSIDTGHLIHTASLYLR